MTISLNQHVALAEMTAELVAAYVAKNSVRPADLPALIASIHGTLGSLDKPETQVAAEPPKPAVSVKKSITDEYLISLEDGRRFKSLKRYLGLLGMTPDDYRAKWGLPKDYPMVAPNYAAQRSALAKTIGLGRKAVAPQPAPMPAEPPVAAKKRGRPKAA